MADEIHPYQKSIDFAKNISDKCTLTDGYVCLHVGTDNFNGKPPDQFNVPGNYIAPFMVAYNHFRQISELTAEQKDLKHYRIRFTEDSENYIIQFGGLLLPNIKNGKPDGIILAVYGKTTTYWLDKNTLNIKKYLFSK